MNTLETTIRYLARDKAAAAWLRVSVVLAALAILIGLTWLTSAVYLARLERNVAEYEAFIAASDMQAEARDAFVRHGKRVDAILSRMEERFSQPGIVQEIERLATGHQIDLVTQEYRQHASRGAGSSWGIFITAEGGYAGLKEFLADLQEVRGLGLYEKAKLDRASSDGVLHLTVELTVLDLSSR